MKVFSFIICLTALQLSAQISKVFDIPGVPEISGNIFINRQLWTLNDGQHPPVLLQLDTLTGDVIDSTVFTDCVNNDWEELASNGTQIFIGDFGNNQGIRKDLKIYRFAAAELGNKGVTCDTIGFYYPNQKTFKPTSLTSYDCEAMLAYKDSLVLYSKSILDAVCRIYSIPNKPGYHAARLLDSVPLDFWVTGAALNQQNLILCGYGFNGQLTPQYVQGALTAGKVFPTYFQSQHVNILGANQIEGVYMHNSKVFFTCENSNGFPAAMYSMNFTPMEAREIQPQSGLIIKSSATQKVTEFEFDDRWLGGRLSITNTAGAEVWSAKIVTNRMAVLSSELSSGTYIYQVRLRRKRLSGKFVVE